MERALYFVARFVIAWFAAVMALTVIYRVVPPVSTVMVANFVTFQGAEAHWVPLNEISPNVVRAVLVSEDARFCEHYGIDWRAVDKAMREAQRKRRDPRGASTISMQVARNLFLWNGRSWIRKALEAPIALWVDFVLPKRRILEIYLNIAEWGKGQFGIDAAARHQFGQSARYLSATQAAQLVVMLPDPTHRSAAHPGPASLGMAGTVEARMGGADTRCVR